MFEQGRRRPVMAVEERREEAITPKRQAPERASLGRQRSVRLNSLVLASFKRLSREQKGRVRLHGLEEPYITKTEILRSFERPELRR